MDLYHILKKHDFLKIIKLAQNMDLLYGVILENLISQVIKKLIKSRDLEKYNFHFNKIVESFNYIINQCYDSNNRITISKLEEILKYMFINMDSNINNKIIKRSI